MEMKKKIIISVLLSVTVLFSILGQAIHSYDHHSKLLSEKKCQHDLSKNKNEITHSHTLFEKCMICDFNFNLYTTPDFYSITFDRNNAIAQSILLCSQKQSSFFRGCLFSLRAPPTT